LVYADEEHRNGESLSIVERSLVACQYFMTEGVKVLGKLKP